MGWVRICLSALVLLASLQAQTKRALLIGINQYAPLGQHQATVKIEVPRTNGPSRWDVLLWNNLKGPLNDVELMRAVLVSPKFAFPNDPQHIHVLKDGQATRQGILDAMQKYLVDEPASGDTVVFYFSGHGSRRYNSKSIKHNDIMDNTIVPADAQIGQYDVRDREIARIFNRALDKGIRLTAIFDSCHSGSIARGIRMESGDEIRYLEYDPRDINEGPDMLPNGQRVPAPEDRKDNPALIFTATQYDQTATGRVFNGTMDGAFTRALVDALRSLPADTPAIDVYKGVKVIMERMLLPDQQPSMAGAARMREPLFSRAGSTTRNTVAVVSDGVQPDDSILLNAGYISDIGVGSILVGTSDNAAGRPRLQITEVLGIDRSQAKIVGDAGTVRPKVGDLFELERWVPLQHSRLTIFVPPPLTAERLRETVVQAGAIRKALGQSWVEDPLITEPTHMLLWDGTNWILSKSGSNKVESLGPVLKSQALLGRIHPSLGTHLFIDLPPSSEFMADMKLDDSVLPIEIAKNRASAQYLLMGHIVAEQSESLEYTWVRNSYIEKGLTIQVSDGQIDQCSIDSSYPARSDWAKVPLVDSSTSPISVAATASRELIRRLARVRSWLELPAPLSGPTSGFPYHLALRNRETNAVEKIAALKGQNYDLVLVADGILPAKIKREWVYVLDIDCEGNGNLLYPSVAEGNYLPPEGEHQDEIPLTKNGTPIAIHEPFGLETYILLITSTPLPDPDILNFEGALRRGPAEKPLSPLEELFRSTSSGTPGPTLPLPTDWNIGYLHLPSADAPPRK